MPQNHDVARIREEALKGHGTKPIGNVEGPHPPPCCGEHPQTLTWLFHGLFCAGCFRASVFIPPPFLFFCASTNIKGRRQTTNTNMKEVEKWNSHNSEFPQLKGGRSRNSEHPQLKRGQVHNTEFAPRSFWTIRFTHCFGWTLNRYHSLSDHCLKVHQGPETTKGKQRERKTYNTETTNATHIHTYIRKGEHDPSIRAWRISERFTQILSSLSPFVSFF